MVFSGNRSYNERCYFYPQLHLWTKQVGMRNWKVSHNSVCTNSPITQMQSFNPIPRLSPLTITTTCYESSTRNVTSPKNISLSPTLQTERTSPNYVSSTTHRVASPINIHRVTSPITTITHKITTPLTSPLTVKVCMVPMHWLFALMYTRNGDTFPRNRFTCTSIIPNSSNCVFLFFFHFTLVLLMVHDWITASYQIPSLPSPTPSTSLNWKNVNTIAIK